MRRQLAESSDKIQVITANGKTKADIDYDAYKETGYSVIAVGGDKLSRGLTLEGLSVSYFLRVSRQYDSLLQMGRWFGYRRGFADLCRLYTTPDMEDWFRYVATAQKELRAQFFDMAQVNATPKDFGLKIAVHDILEVTAKNKQRHAELRQSSYAGEGKVQTVMFRDRQTIERNAAVTDDFISSLGDGTDSPRRPGPGRQKSRGYALDRRCRKRHRRISKESDLPAGKPHRSMATSCRPSSSDQLAMQPPELTNWTVFLATGDEKEVEIAGRRRNCVLRTPRIPETDSNHPDNRFIIGTTLSPLDQAIDLTDAEFEEALAQTNRERTVPHETCNRRSLWRVHSQGPWCTPAERPPHHLSRSIRTRPRLSRPIAPSSAWSSASRTAMPLTSASTSSTAFSSARSHDRLAGSAQ